MGSLAVGKGNSDAPYIEDEKEHRRTLANVVLNLLNGKSNNHGTITLTANAATTAVTFDKAGVNSKITLSPTTGALGTPTITATDANLDLLISPLIFGDYGHSRVAASILGYQPTTLNLEAYAALSAIGRG